MEKKTKRRVYARQGLTPCLYPRCTYFHCMESFHKFQESENKSLKSEYRKQRKEMLKDEQDAATGSVKDNEHGKVRPLIAAGANENSALFSATFLNDAV